MKLPSLDEFAAANPVKKGPTCSVCMLPPELLKVVHGGKGRHPLTIMAKWLATQGYPQLSRQRLAHHFQDGHTERANGVK